ncbi:MAG: protein kinase domain-containing protein [Candidatus Sericytochromatia bacterium]
MSFPADSAPFEDGLTPLEETDLQEQTTLNLAASHSDSAPPTEPEAGSLTGWAGQRYRILLLLGVGAMGEVFLARDNQLLRKVALKKLLPEVAYQDSARQRFLREVQITAQLDHPSIVPVYTLETAWDQTPAYAMKVVNGYTLKDLLHQARTQYQTQGHTDEAHSLPGLLEHFLKVCDTLAFAHAKGVIHRDLKPANLMIGEFGEVFVLDWGIARRIGDSEPNTTTGPLGQVELDSWDETVAEQTRMGQIMGTPRYLSPEQAAGKNDQLDGRSDQLALGLILYEIITLQAAYTAKSLQELLKQVLKAEKRPYVPFHARAPLPLELQAIADKATARKPADRYPNVESLAEDLRRYLRGEAVSARRDTLLQGLTRWIGHHQLTALSLVVGLILLGALGIGLGLYERQRFLESARQREIRLGQFIQSTARQAQQMNNRFSHHAQLLQRLAAASEALLQRDTPSDATRYVEAKVLLGQQTPPDWHYSPAYQSLISTGWPLLRGGTAQNQRRLMGLGSLLPPLLSDSSYSTAPLKQQLDSSGTPITWAYVALADGLMMTYPGKAGLPEDYDPRQQNWYRSAAQHKGLLWGQAYVDARGQGLVLPCLKALYGSQGEWLGVAGIELSFRYVVDELLALDIPELVEAYLLNAEGQVRVRSADRIRHQGLHYGESRDSAQVLEQPLFHQAAVIRGIKAKPSGYLEYTEEGRHILTAWFAVPALQGYYVVSLDAGRYFTHH